jgi:hypothetical protein
LTGPGFRGLIFVAVSVKTKSERFMKIKESPEIEALRLDIQRRYGDFIIKFYDNEFCRKRLLELIGGENIPCEATCGEKDWTPWKRGFVCSSCRKQTSVKSATIFHDSKVPLNGIFYCINDMIIPMPNMTRVNVSDKSKKTVKDLLAPFRKEFFKECAEEILLHKVKVLEDWHIFLGKRILK